MDAIVVGAGPNGLAAAITLAGAGRSVLVYERAARPGGAVHSASLTRPGFLHDVCSSVYPLGIASPFFRSLPSVDHLWVQPPLAVAHPLDKGGAAWMSRSLDETASSFGPDAGRYRRLFGPSVDRWQALVEDALAPPRLPRHPFVLGRFGIHGIRSASAVAATFRGIHARALLAGLAAHSTLPLDRPFSAGVGLLLGAMAHAVGWPFVAGGANRLVDTLVAELTTRGGRLVTSHEATSLEELRSARTVLCDLTPRQFVALARPRLPRRFSHALARYRYGPGVFKIDWALSGPIPWTADACRQAGTVHVGGTFEEVAAAEAAAWEGHVAERPFVLVTQPSVCDPSRAPDGRHAAWGYCHVPNGSPIDMTTRIENQIERFAPGFREVVLERYIAGPRDLEGANPNLVGGDISGGAMTVRQMLARPTWRGYGTPLEGVFLCSSSTPPGGGVHGMCGFHAAMAALNVS
jgi:phytoene dehydrogenase-like protein